jgi:hypothetical protein
VAEAPIQDGQCQALLAAVTEHLEVGRRAGVPIPPGQFQVPPAAADTTALLRAERTMARRRVADRAEATPEADRMATLLVADTITTKGFLPRFTPHLTHRQEVPKGASCPPRT